jgi:hypothetical protein
MKIHVLRLSYLSFLFHFCYNLHFLFLFSTINLPLPLPSLFISTQNSLISYFPSLPPSPLFPYSHHLFFTSTSLSQNFIPPSLPRFPPFHIFILFPPLNFPNSHPFILSPFNYFPHPFPHNFH